MPSKIRFADFLDLGSQPDRTIHSLQRRETAPRIRRRKNGRSSGKRPTRGIPDEICSIPVLRYSLDNRARCKCDSCPVKYRISLDNRSQDLRYQQKVAQGKDRIQQFMLFFNLFFYRNLLILLEGML